MLGESTRDLLPMLEEAISAGIIESTEDELAFRHDLLWQAVVETLPTAVRRAITPRRSRDAAQTRRVGRSRRRAPHSQCRSR